jgi:hypothetical protein
MLESCMLGNGHVQFGGGESEKYRLRQLVGFLSHVETHFAIMKRMADYGFERATSWDAFCAVHARVVADYNFQAHLAHQNRDDGLRSPSEVLGWVHGRHVDLPTLDRIFHATQVARHLDQGGTYVIAIGGSMSRKGWSVCRRVSGCSRSA